MRKSLLLFALWLVTTCLQAVDLPLVLSWDSHNQLSFHKEQTEKEYRFREFYRLGLGLDSLQVNSLTMRFRLQNRASFLSNQLEVKDFALGYQAGILHFEAASSLTGYGKLNQTNPYHVISATQDDFRYQATRFNYLGLSLAGFSLQSGGNTQNQLMLKASYQNTLEALRLSYSISQEARIYDTHWHTPVAISSLKLSNDSSNHQLICETAVSSFFEHEETPAHNSFYLLVQGRMKARPWLQVFGEDEYRESEPMCQISKLVETGASVSYRQLVFTPGLRWDRVAGGEVESYYFSSDWQFLPDQRAGLLLQMTGGSNPVYSLGFQAALRYAL